ncbi:MAG TPA: hypothetical protein VL527_10475 [Dongiaceae bacterium]|nr:hypothetical protein [Dongiaceae bacterium]
MSLLKRVRSGWRIFWPTCRQASKLQSEALERELSPFQRWGLRLHLLFCRWCRRYGRQIRFLRRMVHEHPEALTTAMPQKLSAAARERIKQKTTPGSQN